MTNKNDKRILGEIPWLTNEKKRKFKKLKGSANSCVDFNKMREYYKYEGGNKDGKSN